MKTTTLTTTTEPAAAENKITPYSGGTLIQFRDLEQMYRVAQFLASSALLPDAFRNNPGSVMIALNMAQRLRMDPLMVMQNIVIVHGNAALSGKFAIALLNRSSKYKRLEYVFCNGKDYAGGVRVRGTRTDGGTDEGTPITMEMARAEGWTANKKWQTMPEQMMRYRAAAFFARAFVPEELMGMQTAEELTDIQAADPKVRDITPAKTALGIARNAPLEKIRDITEDGTERPTASISKEVSLRRKARLAAAAAAADKQNTDETPAAAAPAPAPARELSQHILTDARDAGLSPQEISDLGL